MRRNKIKKVWKKPKLIVLARSMPEENVLMACKHITNLGGPNNRINQPCTAIPPGRCNLPTTT